MGVNDHVQRAATRFAAAYALASLPATLRLLRKRRYGSLFQINEASARLALVPAALPPLFCLVKAIVRNLGDTESTRLNSGHPKRVAERVAATLCAPVILLLPPNLRMYLVIYTLTGALRAFIQSPPDTQKGRPVKGWRRYVPPIWTLALGNTIMLPLWLFGPAGSFPAAYDRVLIDFSKAYYTPSSTPSAPFGIKHLLANTTFPPNSQSSTSRHAFGVCEALHPLEPSCTKTYAMAAIAESLAALKMITAVELISPIFRKRFALFDPKQLPETVARALHGIVGGCLYVGGGISSSWAATCLLQRIIPPGRFLRARFVLNGMAAMPWIFVVPASRRAELSMYMFRMTLFNLLSVYKHVHGTRGLKQAEIATFAASWVCLLGLRDKGYRLEKFTARMLQLLDA